MTNFINIIPTLSLEMKEDSIEKKGFLETIVWFMSQMLKWMQKHLECSVRDAMSWCV